MRSGEGIGVNVSDVSSRPPRGVQPGVERIRVIHRTFRDSRGYVVDNPQRFVCIGHTSGAPRPPNK